MMNGREKNLLARHCLLHPEEVVKLWRGGEWEKLACVVEYARKGTPDDMALTDPFMYRKLCAGLCEYKIRGFGGFDPAALQRLARDDCDCSPGALAPDVGATGAGVGLNREEWNDKLESVGRELARRGAKAFLTVIGAVPGILAGQPSRFSMNLAVWNPASKFERENFQAAVEAAGLLYDPMGDRREEPCVRVVEPGVVQMGRFEPEPVDQYGALWLFRAPAANIVASKLARAGESDLHDIAWLMAHYRADPGDVRRIVRSFPRDVRGRATENLVYLRCVEPMEEARSEPTNAAELGSGDP